MKDIAIAPGPLDRVSNGVAEIQEGSFAGLLALVGCDDRGFDLDIAANQRR